MKYTINGQGFKSNYDDSSARHGRKAPYDRELNGLRSSSESMMGSEWLYSINLSN